MRGLILYGYGLANLTRSFVIFKRQSSHSFGASSSCNLWNCLPNTIYSLTHPRRSSIYYVNKFIIYEVFFLRTTKICPKKTYYMEFRNWVFGGIWSIESFTFDITINRALVLYKKGLRWPMTFPDPWNPCWNDFTRWEEDRTTLSLLGIYCDFWVKMLEFYDSLCARKLNQIDASPTSQE